MPISQVLLSDTFGQFRNTFNDTANAVNSVVSTTGNIVTGNIVGSTLTANNLTSGRVTLATTAGQLTDDSALTYDTATDILTLGGTTDASSSTTGTLKVAGGLGVAKKLFVGTDLAVEGTTDTSSPTTGALKVAGGLGVAKKLHVGTDLTVVGNSVFTGNVSFLGSNTLISTTVVNIEDNILQLSHLNPSDLIDIGFIGGYNNGANVHSGLFRDATDDTWKLFRNYSAEPSSTIDVSANGFAWANLAIGGLTAANGVNITTGQTYKINGTAVLDATTLGSGVTGSSLTSVGTIGTGVWQGTLIGPTYGGTGVNNGVKTITLGGNLVTSGAFATTITATGTTSVTLPTSGTLVGSADTGTVTSTMIADGTIVNGDISASAAIAYSKLSLSGSIVNADINASAAIAVSKLASSAVTVGTTAITLGTSSTTLGGLTSVTSTSFVGTLTGNASTATSATTAGTVTTAAQPSITSVGTLTALTVSGDGVFSSTGALKIPSGTTGQQSGYTTVGMVRFNTTTDALEVYKSTGWASAGGGVSSAKLYYYGSF
jgi:hypothetical protein